MSKALSEQRKISKISIPYGKKSISLLIPEKNINFNGKKQSIDKLANNIDLLNNALINPIGPPLDQLSQDKSVVCLIYDATRKVPQNDFIEVVFTKLRDATNVCVILATGTHDGEIEENYQIVSMVKEQASVAGISLRKVLIHNCHEHEMIYAGQTETLMNDIYVNAEIREAEVFVVYSDMKNHYFGGYSNALKNFFPGIADYRSVERNHALAMDPKSTFGHHPLHPDKNRRDNPLAQDMWEAYQLIVQNRPVFLVATVTKKQDIIWTGAGLLEQVVSLGIKKVDEEMSVAVQPADKIVVGCGGFPNDESLYMAQRALELSQAGVKNGGEILFIAECANGIGPERSIKNFYNPLTQPVTDILQKYENRKYIMYAHKTYKFAQMIATLKNIYLKTELKPDMIRKIHLIPVVDAQDIIDNWLQDDPDVAISIFSEGNKIGVHAIG